MSKEEEKKEPLWITSLRNAIAKRNSLAENVEKIRAQLEATKASFQQAQGLVEGIIEGAGSTPKAAQELIDK